MSLDGLVFIVFVMSGVFGVLWLMVRSDGWVDEWRRDRMVDSSWQDGLDSAVAAEVVTTPRRERLPAGDPDRGFVEGPLFTDDHMDGAA